MAESLLAIILVTSSSKGSNLVFHWPPNPSSCPRLNRPKPRFDEKISFVDNSWTTSTSVAVDIDALRREFDETMLEGWEYEWKRPQAFADKERAANARTLPGSRRASPSRASYSREPIGIDYEYDYLLGYPSEFLANILSPKDDMCHQKFELVVDDLAFIGHPVCAEADGTWRFKKERGRGGSKARNEGEDGSTESELPSLDQEHRKKTSTTSPPHTFHLVLVIDLPDPSSSASGNVFKYFHVIYDQLCFTVTAVLFQEQVLNHFVDVECESLTALRESSYSRGTPFPNFIKQALESSQLARAMKALFEAVKANSIARLVLNDVGIEVQLPPELDRLLHAEDENPDFIERPDPDAVSWGSELSFGWGLPSLAPWKSLLLCGSVEDHNDLKLNLSRPGLSAEDHPLAEGLLQFLETVSIFDSLNVVAHSLDWVDLERQVYPIVRWLVYHRKAKVVDTVHRGLRTVFALSSRITKPLPVLAKEFERDFPHPSIPSLPKLFAMLSNPRPATSKPLSATPSRTQSQMAAHGTQPIHSQPPLPTTPQDFFTSVVKSKDLIPLYQDVVVWLLRRELIVVLHLHIRLVATPGIKEKVRQRAAKAARRRLERMDKERGREKERQNQRGKTILVEEGPGADVSPDRTAPSHVLYGIAGEPLLPVMPTTARRHSNQSSRAPVIAESGIAQSLRHRESFVSRGRRSSRRRLTEEDDLTSDGLRSGSRLRYALNLDLDEEGLDEEAIASGEDDDDFDYGLHGESWNRKEDALPTIISEPWKATPLQRKWIEAMSEGKDREVVQRFQLINRFFDGRRTDDEIMYLAEINRKQLREVLQRYDDFLLTALHPA